MRRLRNHRGKFVFLRISPTIRAWLFGLGLLAPAVLMAAIGVSSAAEGPGGEEEQALAAMAGTEGKSGRQTTAGAGVRLEAGGSVLAPADVSGAGMAVWRDNVKASYDMDHFGFDLGYAGSHYDFSKVGHLPFGGSTPFDSLHRFDAGVTVKGGLWGNVSGFASLRGSVGYERDLGDGITGTPLAGIIVPLGGQWTMTLGGGASFNKVETKPVPIVGLRYQNGGPLSVDLGFPRTEIAWRGGTWWSLRLAGGIEAGQYKLADDNPVAPDGSVALLSPQAGLWFDVRPTQGLTASIGGLYSLPGTMTFYRESGSRIKRFDVGGAPGGALRLRYEF
uniref:Uncharacterized protein n=1 Tax=Desulfovibrio sp. U5L TaxID=596152 RepID=I2PX54_9BACT